MIFTGVDSSPAAHFVLHTVLAHYHKSHGAGTESQRALWLPEVRVKVGLQPRQTPEPLSFPTIPAAPCPDVFSAHSARHGLLEG